MSYKIAVLISGSGTNLQALIDAQETGALGAEIALVVSDRADAYGLQRAIQHDIPTAFIPLPRAPKAERAAVRAAWEQRLLVVINAFTPNLIVMAGFMRVVSAVFLEQCRTPVINQHPALLPEDGGDTVTTRSGLIIPALRGAHVVADALQRGLPVTGCTVHHVTPIVDDGPILATAEIPILPHDDEYTLHERIKQEEQRLIVDVVAHLARQNSQ
jgi:phosphoribosylglycinamide formyltransferase-1